jgi:hypothetical protein
MVQRSAVMRKNSTARALTNGLAVGQKFHTNVNVAVDGLYVFPETQSRTDEAFTTFEITGYGRTRTTMRDVRSERAGQTFIGTTIRILGRYRQTIVTQDGVIPAEAETPLIQPTINPLVTYQYLAGGFISMRLGVYTNWITENVTRTNYGRWDELVVTWAANLPESISV